MSATSKDNQSNSQKINSFFWILLSVLLVLCALSIYKPTITSYTIFLMGPGVRTNLMTLLKLVSKITPNPEPVRGIW